MKVTIQPSVIKGTIHAPASKSSMQRACAAALLHSGHTVLSNYGISNDDKAALAVIQSLGATIETLPNDTLLIQGSKFFNKENTTVEQVQFSCGESGLGIRMFAPIAALIQQPVLINGEGSLLSRPMNFFDEVFPQLGVTIQSNNGKLPIHLTGPLVPADITIDGSLSSQFLTGLLFAFGKAATVPVCITVDNLKSKPYIDLTVQVMAHFGYQITNNDYENFIVQPKLPTADSIHYTIEGDWSGAAFLLVAGALAGDIVVQGLDVFSTQADKAILQALIACGCNISIQEKQIEVGPVKVGMLKPFHFNATDCPDLFPPLVALAAYCDGTTVIEGVSRLAHKESDRAITLQEEFGKMGITIVLQDDLMLVYGGTGIKGCTVHSRHDHRIAMACAVAALKSQGEVIIEEANAINKSYPNFYQHLQQLGVQINETQTISS
jgi:3-phosphoshikimate 1-carboxyvinyltransferase